VGVIPRMKAIGGQWIYSRAGRDAGVLRGVLGARGRKRSSVPRVRLAAAGRERARPHDLRPNFTGQTTALHCRVPRPMLRSSGLGAIVGHCRIAAVLWRDHETVARRLFAALGARTTLIAVSAIAESGVRSDDLGLRLQVRRRRRSRRARGDLIASTRSGPRLQSDGNPLIRCVRPTRIIKTCLDGPVRYGGFGQVRHRRCAALPGRHGRPLVAVAFARRDRSPIFAGCPRQ